VTTFAEWVPPAGIAVRGTVVLIPGRGEPASVYTRLGTRLAVDGYRVLASGDPTIEGLQALIEDADPSPVVVIGSDTGALTALQLASSAPGRLAGAVLAGLPLTPAAANPGDGPGGRPGEPPERSWDDELDARTACPVHRARLSEDPHLVRGAIWSSSSINHTALPTPLVPTLALHGELDVIAPWDAVAPALSARPGLRLVQVAGGRHDVLNDVQHRSVAAEIVQFLERLRASSSAEPILSELTGTVSR
jgi:pimeloyl-ACP methyl ester carboxylesterase